MACFDFLAAPGWPSIPAFHSALFIGKQRALLIRSVTCMFFFPGVFS